MTCVLLRRLWPSVAKHQQSYRSGFRSFANLPEDVQTAEWVSEVTSSQLRSMLSKRDLQLFDVRNPDEFKAGRIPHAVNMPLDALEESLKMSPESFQQRFQVRAPAKDDDNIVFHCFSGRRSAKALDIARKMGFNRARHYKGGYSEWAEQERKNSAS
uniref:thiosulfate:glutathione sulfurtransferase n=1 Tax=Doryrhamphus excisus TaxID=161450 RepID=UPI0025AEB544|nr:thiosulfate:glutathione sulfurtransferase [Doryrhamphus excisus]